MNYFQPYLPPLDDAIVAAWDSQTAAAAEIPFLAQALAQSAELFPRFAACYAQLRALPRGARRALQRQLARSSELTAVPPEWRRKLAASLAGAALLLALAQGAQAATIKVTTNNPALNQTDTKCSLIEAIINANNDDQSGSTRCAAGSGADTIVLPKNSTQTLIYGYDYAYGATGLPLITSQITITGTGAKIVGGGYGGFRLMAVGYYGNLTLKNLTLRGASYYGYGGGIINFGTLTIDKVTISGNTAYGGGGVSSSGSLTIMNGSTVSGNSGYAGGGVFVGKYSSATITNSTISGNSAADGRGGGIFNDYGATLAVTYSTISGNSAQGASRGGTGGGVYTRSALLTITNSTISGNTVGGYYYNGYYGPVGSGGRGGGIFAGGDIFGNGTVTVSNSTITGNSAASAAANFPGVGGGIYNAASYISNLSNNYLTLNRSLISGNSATIGSQIANRQPVTVDVYTPPYNSGYPGYIITPGFYTTVNVITAANFNLFGSNNDAGIYDPGVPPDPYVPGDLGTPGLVPGATDIVPLAGVTTSNILSSVLKANGGLTKTHALVLKTSPALKKVPKAGCPATDQRGTKRPQPTKDTFCDIGSFEQK
jgi:hypothetical protein